jgi:hypothetical protein
MVLAPGNHVSIRCNEILCNELICACSGSLPWSYLFLISHYLISVPLSRGDLGPRLSSMLLLMAWAVLLHE